MSLPKKNLYRISISKKAKASSWCQGNTNIIRNKIIWERIKKIGFLDLFTAHIIETTTTKSVARSCVTTIRSATTTKKSLLLERGYGIIAAVMNSHTKKDVMSKKVLYRRTFRHEWILGLYCNQELANNLKTAVFFATWQLKLRISDTKCVRDTRSQPRLRLVIWGDCISECVGFETTKIILKSRSSVCHHEKCQ